MDTPLNRVESVLKNSDEYMYTHQIARAAHTEEKETKKALGKLFSMGQIEQIPSVNRWGPRYAWLQTKPVAVEPPAIPEEDLAAGVQAAITGDGSGEPLPELPMLGCTPEEAIAAAFEGVRESAAPTPFWDLFASQAGAVLPTRYAVAVPRRPLRIVKTRARAEALALAAVRRGAKGAEVYALTPLGRAKRDATFEVRP